eukprot:Tamp_16070.p1 GENE.Tamp_16070~~Tamp_16070.p1  ORF type:complete len:429 (-),score=75.30 Tamp_16070:48-1334(-)
MSADAAMVDDLVADAGDLPALPRPTAEDINKSGFTKEMTKKWLVELAGSLKNAGCKAADRVGVLKAKLKELLDVDDAEEEDAGDVEGAAAKRVQERFAAAKDPAAVAFCVRQQLDASAKQLSKGKETVQKVRRSLDQLRVALMIGDPVFWVDGQGVVQPASWVSVQHHAVRACLVVGDDEKTAARMNALDAEIDARLRPQAGGGRRGAAKQVNQGFDAPDPILAAIGVAGQQRLMFEYWCVWGDKPLAPVEQPINVPYDKGSYMAQLYGAVQDHLHQAGQRKVPNMESIKAFRDFLCKWCHVWASWVQGCHRMAGRRPILPCAREQSLTTRAPSEPPQRRAPAARRSAAQHARTDMHSLTRRRVGTRTVCRRSPRACRKPPLAPTPSQLPPKPLHCRAARLSSFWRYKLLVYPSRGLRLDPMNRDGPV